MKVIAFDRRPLACTKKIQHDQPTKTRAFGAAFDAELYSCYILSQLNLQRVTAGRPDGIVVNFGIYTAVGSWFKSCSEGDHFLGTRSSMLTAVHVEKYSTDSV